MMRPEDEFLYRAFRGDLSTLPPLQQRCRFNDVEAARACLVTRETYQRWIRTGKPSPTAVKLLAVLAGYVPWDGWYGWEVHRGYLFPPGFTRHGVTPGHIQSMIFSLQLAETLKKTNRELKEELEALRAEQSKPLSIQARA